MSDDETQRRLYRRTFLAAALGAGVALAGCGQQPSQQPTEEPTTPQTGDDLEPTTTTTPTEPTRVTYAGFLDEDELRAIQRKVAAREDPWNSGFLALRRSANRALGTRPTSVVTNGAPGELAPNRFATDADRTDYTNALQMSHAIRDLGIAYAFTGDDRYAQKAISLLDHWCLDPETAMYPSGRNHGEAYFSIELYITIPAMIYGASFLSGHTAWEDTNGGEPAFRAWVSAFLADLEAGRGKNRYTGVLKNNIYAWWIHSRATAAAYLDDRDVLDAAFDDWRSDALDQLTVEGVLEYERQREDGLQYSMYGLKALTMTAEIARHYDVDLYDYRSADVPETSALKRAFTYYAKYVASSDGWEWGIGDEGYTDAEREEAASVYELAYSQWGDEMYLEAVNSVGRPVFDRRILGWTSLTHANRFALTDE
ncbi:alginate lyase family protein [Haladaptatus sp. DJG-WS-42]|uniref:alginate lyase family protein n=1 Tax=Haladaptatus sp. DJG-WS-42 TaxID=3120516 RepID=UPI0030CB6FB2